MAKSSTKKRTPPQAADWLDSGLDDSAVGTNNRKKAKVLPSDSKFIYYITITIIYLFSLFARSTRGPDSSIFESEQR